MEKATLMIMLILGSLLGTWRSATAQGIGTPSSSEDEIHVVAMRKAGIENDHTQIPFLVATLQHPSGWQPTFAALHSLAQLGATKALPTINALIQKNQDDGTIKFARVARARLIAESSTKKIPNVNKRAEAELNRFLTELQLTSKQLSTTLESQGKAALQRSPSTSVEVYALREVADMIYLKHDLALSRHAKDLGIPFDVDDPAAEKMRLAQLSRKDRLNMLLEELATARALTPYIFYTTQLAVDEGLPASRLAGEKLKYMQTHREQYPLQTGFTTMFSVIAGVGDKEQAPIVARFQTKNPSWLTDYDKLARSDKPQRVSMAQRQDNHIVERANQFYPTIMSGLPRVYRADY